MTIETIVNASGDTVRYIHPAGISYYDQTPETVIKANATDILVAGDQVELFNNTVAGETWRKFVSVSTTVPRRYGYVTIASGSGSPTVTMKRFPRVAISCAINRTFGTIGGATNSLTFPSNFNNGCGNPPSASVSMVSVAKPVAENWVLNDSIYGYKLSGIDTFTKTPAVANAASVRWVHGRCALAQAPGLTNGAVHQYLCFDSMRAINFIVGLNLNQFATKIQLPFSGLQPLINGNILSASDGLTVSRSNPNASANTFLGLCVGIDETTTPATYSYVKDFNFYSGVNAESITALYGGYSMEILQIYPGFTNAALGGPDYWPNIGISYNSSGQQTAICAPNFLVSSQACPPDIAYEPLLPAPFNSIRVIWSYVPQNATFADASLVPSMAKRSTESTQPYAAMTTAKRERPRRFASVKSAIGYIPHVNTGRSVGQNFCQWPLVTESRNIPYVWETWFQGSGTFSSVSSTRGANVPSGTIYYSCGSSVEWCWGSNNYTTGLVTAITPWVAASFLGGIKYSAAVTPPVLAADEVVRLVLMTRIGGFQIVFGIDEIIYGLSGYWSPDYSSGNFGVWPYDVVKFSSAIDAGGAWSTNAGWIWSNEPIMPTVTWSNLPSSTLSGNTLTTTTLNPIATITAVAKIAGTSLCGNDPSALFSATDGAVGQMFPLNGFGIGWQYGSSAIGGVGMSFGGGTFTSLVYPTLTGLKNFNLTLIYNAKFHSVYGDIPAVKIIQQSFTLP